MILHNLSFAVMAGGAGRRFGGDKTKALLHDKELYLYGLELGANVSNDVMLISRDKSKYSPYIEHIRYLEDEYEFQAPMAGIMTALKNAKNDNIFILSADAPLCHRSVVELLNQQIKDFDAIIPEINGKYHNLSAIYSKKILKKLENQYANGDYRLTNAYKNNNISFIKEDQFELNQLSSFININTTDDLVKASKLQ